MMLSHYFHSWTAPKGTYPAGYGQATDKQICGILNMIFTVAYLNTPKQNVYMLVSPVNWDKKLSAIVLSQGIYY